MEAEPVPDLSSFKHYARAKQTIAQEIRTLSDFLQKRLGDREAEECRQLMVKLAEDRFALAVVGQFKRGKSSLMNAIIGQDILPTGVLPLTSAITVLKYGPREKFTILRDGASYAEEVPISSIADHVTQKGNPGNAKKVTCAYLELPVQFLRRGLEFVDTPGIGSAIEANTATTYDYLPRSDAVIFVTSVDTPLTRVETDFLQSIQEHVRKVFFVVNKIDLAADDERQEIMEFISETLRRQVQAEELRIYPVSSAMALASTLAGKEDGYEKSGVKALQEALSNFLSNEKSGVLLVSVLDKALLLARNVSGGMHLLKLAGEVSQEEIQEKTTALAERFQSLREARARLLIEVRERVISWAEERISSEVGSFLAVETSALVKNLDETLLQLSWKPSFRMARHFARHALQRLVKDIDEWAAQQTERFNPELLEVLGNEWARIELELQKIPVSAGEILGASGADAFRGGQGCEPPIHGVLTQPTRAKIEWHPTTSILQALLPVSVVRSWIRKRLLTQIHAFIGACAYQAEDQLLRQVHHVLNGIGSEMEKRAAEIESRIMQALQRKRFLKGIDGRWRVVELDTQELAGEMEILAGIERRLSSIRTQMLQTKPLPYGELTSEPEIQPAGSSLPSTEERESLEQLVRKATGIEGRVDFAGDLNTRGCAVCNRMDDAAAHFFASWQYALSTQERAQRAYAASLGFCSLHTWQLEAMASPLGVSIGFSTLMERLSADLSRLAASEESNPSESVQALAQDPSRCSVCRLVRDAEETYLKGLAGFMRTDEGQKAYGDSQGVCLHHLGMLIGDMPTKELVRFLLAHAARRFLEISEDMRNYALKRDALRYHMLNQDEKDAYLRALIHTAGAKRVCFPWEIDKEV
jgi:predicted GTPase